MEYEEIVYRLGEIDKRLERFCNYENGSVSVIFNETHETTSYQVLKLGMSGWGGIKSDTFLYMLYARDWSNGWVFTAKVLDDAEDDSDAIRQSIKMIDGGMAIIKTRAYQLRTGETWGAANGAFSAADVIIPIGQIERLSNEEIGDYVRAVAEKAFGKKIPEPVSQEQPPMQIEDKQTTRNNKPGYVYLMHGIGTEWYKIGLSIDPDKRRVSLETKSPYEIELLNAHKVDDMYTEEAFWHEKFAEKRANGEWFTLSEDDVHEFTMWYRPEAY